MPRRLLLASLLLLGAGCARPAPPEEPLFIPDFQLTERNGRTVSKADLDGKVWVGCCFFSHCAGICTQLNGMMARLQQELGDQADFRLVSISLDPDRDTPQVLQDYAAKFQANPNRWLFLTGPKDKVHALIQEGLRLGVSENQGTARKPGNEFEHSPRLVLVDRHGRLRGWYNMTDDVREEQVTELARQALIRLREKR